MAVMLAPMVDSRCRVYARRAYFIFRRGFIAHASRLGALCAICRISCYSPRRDWLFEALIIFALFDAERYSLRLLMVGMP